MTHIKTNGSCWTKREQTARIMPTKLLQPQPLHPPFPKAPLYFLSSHNYLCNSAWQAVAELRQQHPLEQTGLHHAVSPLTLWHHTRSHSFIIRHDALVGRVLSFWRVIPLFTRRSQGNRQLQGALRFHMSPSQAFKHHTEDATGEPQATGWHRCESYG